MEKVSSRDRTKNHHLLFTLYVFIYVFCCFVFHLLGFQPFLLAPRTLCQEISWTPKAVRSPCRQFRGLKGKGEVPNKIHGRISTLETHTYTQPHHANLSCFLSLLDSQAPVDHRALPLSLTRKRSRPRPRSSPRRTAAAGCAASPSQPRKAPGEPTGSAPVPETPARSVPKRHEKSRGGKYQPTNGEPWRSIYIYIGDPPLGQKTHLL